MSDIVEHPDGREPRLLQIGEGNPPIPFKVYQDIYHHITGRTEQIRKRYSDDLILSFPAIEQLHHKIKQMCDVHHVVASSESVTIFYDKERKEQFTSFDRFRSYNANATNPCVSVVLKYDFAVTLAGLPKPQRYSVSIRLTSRVAALKQAEDDAPAFMQGRLVAFINQNTAEVTVEYADYIVARGFTEAFEEWIRGCETTPKQRWLDFMRRRSHWISPMLRGGMVLLVAVFAWLAIDSGATFSQPADALRFLVVFGAGSYLLALAAGICGQVIEDTIDSYPVLSYLRLNRGDDRLIEEFNQRRRGLWWRFARSSCITVGLGVLSGCIERLL